MGQNAWEEIDFIEKGKNYGWHIMESFHCYNPSSGCDTTGLTLPIWEYGHNQQGGYSITGGFVYRGKNAQEIYGKYVYGDYVSGNIWTLEYDGGNVSNTLLFPTNYNISTFAVDQENDLYFADYSSGKIYKFTGTPTDIENNTLPDKFELKQNYPNPFNPETSIEYKVGSIEFVSLKIYDVIGKEVVTLVNELQRPGIYSVRLSAIDYQLSSGIYFYKLIAGNFSQTKKMLLLK